MTLTRADRFWDCTLHSLTDGADYTMLEVERSAVRLRFTVAPGELWAPWCAASLDPCAQAAVPAACEEACSCDDMGCDARLEPRLQFDLAFHDGRLEGATGTSELRLERLR
jgi:hypothetical protein